MDHTRLPQSLPLTTDTPATFDLPAEIDFRPWLASVLPDIQAMLPHLALADLQVGILTDKLGQLRPGTPLVQYATETGPQLLAFPVTATTDDQQTAAAVDDADELAGDEELLPAGNPLLLGLGKQLGIALGKSLLKKLDPKLYITCFGESTDELVAREISGLKHELKDFMREMQMEAKEDEFIKVRGWLRGTYSQKLETLAKGKYVDATIVLNDLSLYQLRMQELAEVIERRITPEQLASCDYATRLKVELHRLAYLQRLVLMAARIQWYRIAKDGQAEDSLEDEFRTYAADRLAVSERMLEQLRQARYNKIVGPYHLNASQYDNERETYLDEGGLFFSAGPIMMNYYSWRDEFESHKSGDPFSGDKMYQTSSYNILLDVNLVSWLPGAPKSDPQEQNRARLHATQDCDKHKQEVQRLFEQYVQSPIEQARSSVQAGLDALDVLQRDGIALK